MEALAQEYEPRGFASAFIYVREAHPGEYMPYHDSFERKLANARRFRDEQSVRRPILVDTLDGKYHRIFGALPNMTLIVLRGGTLAYKGAWTDAADVRVALEQIANIAALRRQGGRLAPFWTERLAYRVVDQAAFNAGLERNGPKAVAEFMEMIRNVGLDRLEE
jgi:hypothetical protein